MVSGGMNGGLGGVRASSIVGNDLLLVGRFNYAGPARRSLPGGFVRNGFLILDKSTGTPSIHDFDPGVNGSIEAMDCEGNNCVVAGGFNIFNGTPVHQIAKFNVLTGEVDQNFRPWLIYQGSYSTLLYRNGIVYAGGDFASFQTPSGQIVGRSYLAAFDAAGQLTNWNPDANRQVSKLRMSPFGTIFAAGSFDFVGGAIREGFAEITPNGKITKFHPTPPVSNSGVVGRDIAFYNKNIILAGSFQVMAGNTHYGLAMVTPDGTDTSWNAQTTFGFAGRSVAVLKNNIYVSFDSPNNQIGGQIRKRLAEVNLQTGLATSFQADVEVGPYPDDFVGIRDIQALSARTSSSPKQIYLTGLFTGIAGTAQQNVAFLTFQ
jgi:hypothetical protein